MDTEPQKVAPDKIISMVVEIVTTRADEMDCPECYQHLDEFADLLANGADPRTTMPRLRDHLRRCVHCSEEFEALLEAMRHLP